MRKRHEAAGAPRLGRAIGERLSYANVMATAAVFIALGGSAWAVAQNSVGTKQLKDNAVSAKKIKKNAVGTAKVKNKAVTARKLDTGSVRAAKLGPITEVTANSDTVANGGFTGATATCPAGTRVVSGGFDGGGAGFSWRIQRTNRQGNGWRAFGTNQTGGLSFLQATAYCLDA